MAAWIPAVLAGAATFVAVFGMFWPFERKDSRLIAAWHIPDDAAFDEALASGEPLPWQRVE